MKDSFFRHIAVVIVAAAAILSCQQEGRIIPRNKMCRIYQEMFLADTWLLNSDADVREKSDTTAFYEPIFNSFGYTTEDYLRSVDHYLKDPDRFSKMMLKVRDNIDAELKHLQEEQARISTPPALEEAEQEEPDL